ncbi:MAG: 2-dehydropantoate 2-reductase N-terminal domain-containing protein, partial [Gammaproteobacteria bacterium]
MTTVAILGAGSWGTALAIQLASNGHDVRAWDHDAELISALQADAENKRYLPGNKFPNTLFAEHDLASATK